MTDKASPSDNPGEIPGHHPPPDWKRDSVFTSPILDAGSSPPISAAGKGPLSPPSGKPETVGLMLYDMDYADPANITPIFFRAKLEQGVLSLDHCEVFR